MAINRFAIKNALKDQYMSMEEMDDAINSPEMDADADLAEAEAEQAELAEDSETVSNLMELKEVNDMTTESFGRSYSAACILAAALESHGVELDVDPSDHDAFPEAVEAAMEGFLADFGKRLRTRWQNFRERQRVFDNGIVKQFDANIAKIKQAVRGEPITAFVTPAIGKNIAIGERFNEATLRGISDSIKLSNKISAWLMKEADACRKLAALARSGHRLSASEVTSILKGHMFRESFPETKSFTFPGNWVITNSAGRHAEWKPITGTGLQWLMSAADGSNYFFFSRLRGVRVRPERVIISPRTQQQILDLSMKLKDTNRVAYSAAVTIGDAIEDINDLFTKYYENAVGNIYTVTESNEFTRPDGLIMEYLNTLHAVSMGIYDQPRFVSLGLRQLMTIR